MIVEGVKWILFTWEGVISWDALNQVTPAHACVTNQVQIRDEAQEHPENLVPKGKMFI